MKPFLFSYYLIIQISKFQNMKKTYIVPALHVQRVQAEQMIAASITGVGGADIEVADPNPTTGVPGEADTKGNFFGDAVWE